MFHFQLSVSNKLHFRPLRFIACTMAWGVNYASPIHLLMPSSGRIPAQGHHIHLSGPGDYYSSLGPIIQRSMLTRLSGLPRFMLSNHVFPLSRLIVIIVGVQV